MKKEKGIRTIFLLWILLSGVTGINAQPCLPEGITFTTQSQIDSFPILYPNCTEIEGDVVILGNDIINLDGLINLTIIGGDFDIGSGNYGNPQLTDISGLENITSVGGRLYISNNHLLSTLSSLNISYLGGGGSYNSGLVIMENISLTNLNGLEGITNANNGVLISENSQLINLQGLHNLTSAGGYLRIFHNNSLMSIAELSNLTTIGGKLIIDDNQNLTSLVGLENIDPSSITDLTLEDNPLLTTCEVQSICDYLISPNGTVVIHDNNLGCNNQAQVEEACTVGIPDQRSDHQLSAYPNPFTTSTTIEYELTEPSNIQLTIYNAIGKEVYRAEDRMMPQGKHSFIWCPEGLPEGMYYAVLRSEEGVNVMKMVKQ